MITGAQCRAARALVEWSRDKLSSNSGVDALVIEEFERRSNLPDQDICDTLQTALENAGAVFIAENGGGVGVRLKLNRSEVRRIGVLENEGGIVGTDAVPKVFGARWIDAHSPLLGSSDPAWLRRREEGSPS